MKTNDASPSEVEHAFIDLSIPPPTNVSQHLAALAKKKMILSPVPGRWRVSQLGAEHIRQLTAGGVSEKVLAAALATPEDATLADSPHSLIPWEFAPIEIRGGIGRFLEGHPFERNVFGISRFLRDVPSDPIIDAQKECQDTCADLGLEFHLASDRVVEELLFSNIVAAMWACRYGIAIIEDTVGEGPNYNVPLEVGAMLITGRPCLLLKDVTIQRPPSDLVAHLYDEVDITKPATIDRAIRDWAKHRLGL